MSTTAAASTATMTIKSFYRIFLKEARHMNDYNFREYAVRRVRQGFRDPRHAALSEQERQQVLHEAQEQLAVLQRQVILGKLYPSGKSVME